MKVPARRLATLSLAGMLVAAPLVSAPSAQAAGKQLICRAQMSDATPQQYSTTYVNVKTGQPQAKVRTVAHYKTTTTAYTRTSNAKGRVSVNYYISGATPGRKVVVSVTVSKNGKSRSCSTSFRPHR